MERNRLNQQKVETDPQYHPLQIWCADMWAVLWNGWSKGNETKVVPEMDFCWATDSEERWNDTAIFHNAGITCSCGGKFYKSNYINKLPYKENLRIKEGTASYMYYKEILDIENKSCLI